MEKTTLFIKKFKCLCLPAISLPEAIQTGYFDFIAFTRSGKTIPTDGSFAIFCDKINTKEMPEIKPIKVISHKDGSSTVLYENIGYIRFYPKI